MKARIHNHGDGGLRRSLVTVLGIAEAACVAVLAAMLSLTATAVSAGSHRTNYCQVLPFVTTEMWGFHAGHAITGATCTYGRSGGGFPGTSSS